MRASDKYNERVEVVLRRSRLAEGLVALAALSTAGLVAALPLALEWQGLALAWIASVAPLALRRLRPGRRLRLEAGGQVALDGAWGALRAGSFVAPWLAIVRWRLPRQRWDRTILVAPDMLCPEDFRRVRVILRFGRFGDRPPGPLSNRRKRTKGTDLAGAHGGP